MNRLKYILKHWKLGVHFLFRTYRFGVNNEWWSDFNSLFGSFSLKTKFSICNNWKFMKFRAGACHFLSDGSYKLLFGKSKD